jgi:hypothetical protein
MIFNNSFVWLHFPKCVGTKIEHLFAKYYSEVKDLHQDPVGVLVDPTISWHDSIEQRIKRDTEFELGSKKVICSIRRLPSWLESRYNFECKRAPDLPHDPDKLLEGKFLENNGYENHADTYINQYLPKTLLESGRVEFVRTENFEKDFKQVFSKFIDTSKVPDWEYDRYINKSESFLPDKIKNELYGSERIYEFCPAWKQVESLAYNR